MAGVAAALLFAQPLRASSCDEAGVAATSVEEVAQSIRDRSDAVGFACVTTIDTPERERQFIDIVAALKGEPGRYDCAPLRIGRVGSIGPGVYRLPVRKGEIALVTLVKTEQGYVTPDCRLLELAKGRADIVRRLAAIAGEGAGKGDSRPGAAGPALLLLRARLPSRT